MPFEVHLDVLCRRIQDAFKGFLAVKGDVWCKNDVLPSQEDMVSLTTFPIVSTEC
jgi:hypothetical protein